MRIPQGDWATLVFCALLAWIAGCGPAPEDGTPPGNEATAPSAEMEERQRRLAERGDTTSPALLGDDDLLSPDALEELVAPIALYPDDLLAVVLAAATFPLDVVQAGRFLEDARDDPALEPDPDWDPSVIALLNYPEALERLDRDLDWTWALGEAVVNQEEDVLDAVQQFRARVHTAGNLSTSDRQLVIEEQDILRIEYADPEVIYVPVYEPAQVVEIYDYTDYGWQGYPYYWTGGYPYYYAPRARFWSGFAVGAAVGYRVAWRHGGIDVNRNVNVNVSRGARAQAGSWDRWSHPEAVERRAAQRDRAAPRPGAAQGNAYARQQTRRVGEVTADEKRARRQQAAGEERWRREQQAGQERARRERAAGEERWRREQQAGQERARRERAAGEQRARQQRYDSYSNRTGYGGQGYQSGGSFGGYQRGQSAHQQSSRGYQSRSASSSFPSHPPARSSVFGGTGSGNRAQSFSSRGAGSRGGGRRGGGRR